MATTRPKVRFAAALMASDITERGWLPIDLARHAGVADMTVYRFLDGTSQTPRTAKKLADALEMPVRRYIVGADGVRPPDAKTRASDVVPVPAEPESAAHPSFDFSGEAEPCPQ